MLAEGMGIVGVGGVDGRAGGGVEGAGAEAEDEGTGEGGDFLCLVFRGLEAGVLSVSLVLDTEGLRIFFLLPLVAIELDGIVFALTFLAGVGLGFLFFFGSLSSVVSSVVSLALLSSVGEGRTGGRECMVGLGILSNEPDSPITKSSCDSARQGQKVIIKKI